MLARLRLHLYRVAITLVLLTGLVVSGGGHRATAATISVEQISFTLFWGEAASDLCGGNDIGDAGMNSGDCAICRLVALGVMPAPTSALATAGFAQSSAKVTEARSRRPCASAGNPAQPVRGPPLG